MSGFHDKVVKHIDKLDADGQRRQFAELAGELDFFESVFQALTEGLLVVDAQGVLTYANGAAEKLLSFSCARAKGRPVRKILPDFDWDGLLATDAEEPNWKRHTIREIEITYPERRILSLEAMPHGGMPVILIRDETAARAQAADQVANGQAQALKELAAGVAHEIGNPLNALAMNLDILARDLRKEPENARRERLLADIAIARDEVRRIDGINREFLAAMRPVRPNLVPGSPADALKDTLAEMKSQFEERRISVTLDLPPALPPVMIDRIQMKQVFFNLVKNALEAMKDGGSLAIEIEALDDVVEVAFRDSGVGLDEADLARLFEPYRTTKKHGNGLGLMICRRIIQAHGGTIDVASQKGEGTRFAIRLPRLEKRIRRLK